jgi:hypothetical protein
MLVLLNGGTEQNEEVCAYGGVLSLKLGQESLIFFVFMRLLAFPISGDPGFAQLGQGPLGRGRWGGPLVGPRYSIRIRTTGHWDKRTHRLPCD